MKIADVLERFAGSIQDLVEELRDAADQPDAAPEAAQARVGREVDYNTSEDTVLEVKAGDLWRLVNRSRKMIRLAREGKIPNMEARAPLCRAIKALKQQGLVRKPHDLRD